MKKMTDKQKKFAALAPPFDKATQADRIVGATGKAYNNGQRKSNMYGGGMASPRKPMQYGGLAQQNRTMTTGMASKENPMGTMTEKKRYDMGMNLGGAIKKFEKKKTGGKTGAKPDYIDIDNDGNRTEPMKQAAKQKKNGKKTG